MVNTSIFGVFILKKDQNLINVTQTENYNEARQLWQSLVDSWVKCISDKRPFIIDNGVNASAFDPGLIHEIIIKSIDLGNRINPNNPYMQQMQNNGFSDTFAKYTRSNSSAGLTEELLDGGFKF